jgi:hypothetical protein
MRLRLKLVAEGKAQRALDYDFITVHDVSYSSKFESYWLSRSFGRFNLRDTEGCAENDLESIHPSRAE